jgi:hypothetical protein
MKTVGDRKLRLRRTLVRFALVAVYIGLAVLVFVGGKGHTLLVDNKNVPDSGLKAFEDVVVGVDSLETSELVKGDRDMFKVSGQRHRISLEIAGQPDKIVKTVVVPMNSDMIVISLPKLAAGVEPYIEPFVPVEFVTPNRETQSFTSDSNGDPAAVTAPLVVVPTP